MCAVTCSFAHSSVATARGQLYCMLLACRVWAFQTQCLAPCTMTVCIKRCFVASSLLSSRPNRLLVREYVPPPPPLAVEAVLMNVLYMSCTQSLCSVDA
jgi:hypothetical protein